jgi:pyruvate,orthophosphate dikinase
MEDKKYVYLFNEANLGMKNLIGGKAANLAEMVSLGMPVPPGFVVSTEVCNLYNAQNKILAPEIEKDILAKLAEIENQTGKKFGDPNNPLLVSVRSGARVSMPGMMSTILNVGMNDEVVEGLARISGNAWFAYDSYRRFVQMYMEVVAMLDKTVQEKYIDELKHKKGIKLDTEMTLDDLKYLISKFKANYKKELKKEFPSDPKEQLLNAVKAVFESWDNKRAILYRRLNDIPNEWGTAAVVQSMVFGNLNENSGTGVAFTRNPSTGENILYGEYLMNAQGEDVVAGVRTPMPINTLAQQNPTIYKQFHDLAKKLEEHYRDMQDMEFTIENGKLYFLQTRSGKRTAHAALKIAVDMVREGKITEKEAVMMINPKQLDSLLHPQFDKTTLANEKPIAQGLPASPGAASGKIVLEAERAKEWKDKGEKVVLVRLETSPEDIVGLLAAEGILTQRGGMTSHAAVVARGMGKCCVAGCHDIKVNEEEGYVEIAGKRYNEGDIISIDGSTGMVYGKEIKTVPATFSDEFNTIMGWADNYRDMRVRANVDTAHDAAIAYNFGAEGVGLVRTEHMFFDPVRIISMVEMIVATTKEERERALAKLLPYQKSDFKGIFKEMKGYPVTIRLLDPPLHEFLPKTQEGVEALAKDLTVSPNTLRATIESLKEFNPMMGHRGLRLMVTFPEIARMQTQAIIEAAIEVNKEHGFNIVPEIMIPLTSDLKEYNYVKEIVVAEADRIIAAAKSKMTYKVGTMIEVPRAVVIADELAKVADFFSFGTNDLTQMSYGFSRDDAGKFLADYYEKKIFDFDPFARLDQQGVGAFVEMASQKAKSVKPDFKLGICGEHGGDPSSVEFFHKTGLTYVSCSAYRVPIARLAAAQASIQNPRK